LQQAAGNVECELLAHTFAPEGPCPTYRLPAVHEHDVPLALELQCASDLHDVPMPKSLELPNFILPYRSRHIGSVDLCRYRIPPLVLPSVHVTVTPDANTSAEPNVHTVHVDLAARRLPGISALPNAHG